jgi:hypothetical protein
MWLLFSKITNSVPGIIRWIPKAVDGATFMSYRPLITSVFTRAPWRKVWL